MFYDDNYKKDYLKKIKEVTERTAPVKDTNTEPEQLICSEDGWRPVSKKVAKFSKDNWGRIICWGCQQKLTIK